MEDFRICPNRDCGAECTVFLLKPETGLQA